MKLNLFGALASTSLFCLYKKNMSNSSLVCDPSKPSIEKKAICILNSMHGHEAKGIVRFHQRNFDSQTRVEGDFTGLKKNSKHGFHIHAYGDLTDGCNTAGPHFNPFNKSHGGKDGEVRHVGDLGNVESDGEGNAKYREDVDIMLMGMYSVVGRSCVLHDNEDDLGRGNFDDSKTTGHSGPRIACGVIGFTSLWKHKSINSNKETNT